MDEADIERVLVDVAAPLVRQIVARYFRAGGPLPRHDAEDVTATINLRLLHRLRRLGPDDPIHDVANYVATLSYNVINDYLRRRFPERARLKNRLRYVLMHDRRLALWSAPAGMVAGLRRWSGSETALTEVPLDVSQATRTMLDRGRPADALEALFEKAGAAVELEALVAFASELWQVTDVAQPPPPMAADPAESVPARLARQEFLRALWREIGELRPMQRKALLLNLRDDETVNVVSLLVRTGVAPANAIAEALEMTTEELAALWNELPLDDLRIAERLGITRQQVINLRKSARERLTRRLFK